MLSALSVYDSYYETEDEIAAALFRSLIIAHGFQNANKRTACLVLMLINSPDCSDEELKKICIDITHHSDIDIDELVKLLYRNYYIEKLVKDLDTKLLEGKYRGQGEITKIICDVLNNCGCDISIEDAPKYYLHHRDGIHEHNNVANLILCDVNLHNKLHGAKRHGSVKDEYKELFDQQLAIDVIDSMNSHKLKYLSGKELFDMLNKEKEEVINKTEALIEDKAPEYKGYKLNFYSSKENPRWDDRYQTFKPRPYDDGDYYWAYSYDKNNWIIVYKGKRVNAQKGSFEDIIDFIEEKNKEIKPRMIYDSLNEATEHTYQIYWTDSASTASRGEEQDNFYIETIKATSDKDAFKKAVMIAMESDADSFEDALLDYGYDEDEIKEFNCREFLNDTDPTDGNPVVYGIKRDDSNRLLFNFDFKEYEKLKRDLEDERETDVDDEDDEENELEYEDIIEHLPKTIEQGFCSGIHSVENGFYDWTLLINGDRIYVDTRPEDKVFKEIAHSIKNTGKLEGTLKSGDDWRVELIFEANKSLKEAYNIEDADINETFKNWDPINKTMREARFQK